MQFNLNLEFHNLHRRTNTDV